MWISEPMPVTTRIMSPASGSTRSANGICRSPDGIQLNTVCCVPPACMPRNARTETANDAIIARQAMPPETAFGRRRPRDRLIRKPTKGSSGISNNIGARLPLQHRERVRAQRLAMAEERDHERQTDRGFGGRDAHHEKRDDLAVDGPQIAPHRDEGDVHRVQHDLDRQQDRDQVLAQEHAGGADRKQDARQDQVVIERDHYGALRAITTAPTIETRMRIDVTSKANACVVKSELPIRETELIDEIACSSDEKPVTPRRMSAQTSSTRSASDSAPPSTIERVGTRG